MKRLGLFLCSILIATQLVAGQGPKTKASAINYVPVAALTPGDRDPALTDKVLSDPKFRTGSVRPPVAVTNKLKVAAFNAYYHRKPTKLDMKNFEGDHLIPLAVGGATTIKNIWCQPWHLNLAGVDVGAKTKDRLEDYVILQYRHHKITLKAAQDMFVPDWTASYKKVIGPLPKFVPAQ